MVHSTKLRVVLYLRMSDPRQDESIGQQRDVLMRLIGQKGYTFVREYKDEGIPGDEAESRPGFQQMVRDCKEKNDFDLILCWSVSRFGRFHWIKAARWIEPLLDAGVKLETFKDGVFDFDTQAGRMMYTFGAEGAQGYVVELSAGTTRGMIDRARRGEWMGADAPYGYRIVEKPGRDGRRQKWPTTLAVGPDAEVETVRWLFKTYADGTHSLRELIEGLAVRRVPRPSKSGGRVVKRKPRAGQDSDRWDRKTITQMFRNQVYLGDFVWGKENVGKYHAAKGVEIERRPAGEKGRVRRNPAEECVTVPGVFPALIDRATWDRVQRRLAENRENTQPKKLGRVYLFTGVIKCGHCGWPMHGTSTSYTDRERGRRYDYQRYVCGSYQRWGRKGEAQCKCNTVVEHAVLKVLVEEIERQFLDPENISLLKQEIRAQEEQELGGFSLAAQAVDDRIAELTRDIDTGTVRYLTAPAALTQALGAKLEEWQAERERLVEERKAMDAPCATLEDLDAAVEGIAAGVMYLKERLGQPGTPEMKAVVRSMVDEVSLLFRHVPYGAKREKSILDGGEIKLKEELVVSKLGVHPKP